MKIKEWLKKHWLEALFVIGLMCVVFGTASYVIAQVITGLNESYNKLSSEEQIWANIVIVVGVLISLIITLYFQGRQPNLI